MRSVTVHIYVNQNEQQTYTSGIEGVVLLDMPSVWPPISLSNTALAAACLASFLERPVPIAAKNKRGDQPWGFLTEYI